MVMLLIKDMLRPLYKSIKNKKIREFYFLQNSLRSIKRNIPSKNIRFLNYDFNTVDAPSFISQVNEIFVEEIYKFEAKTRDVKIIDCGSNIGTSLVYFKKKYPESKIIAFEPDKKIFECAKINIEKNKLKDIELLNKAVWINCEGVSFKSDGADGGAISTCREDTSFVESIRLKNLLDNEKKINLLKIDIEGAETEVIKDCANSLNNVENIFIEYHSISTKEQTLSEILKILESQGFRYYLETIGKRQSPMVNLNRDQRMDMQINIYGYRNQT